MDKRLALQLAKARKSVKRKLEGLREDIRSSRLEFERKLEPLSKPLKALLSGMKSDDRIKKEQSFFGKREYTSSTPETKKSRPEKTVQYIGDREIASFRPYDTESDESTVEENVIIPTMEQLRNAMEVYRNSENFQNYMSQYTGLSHQYIEACITDTKEEFDHLFGVRFFVDDGTFKIGDSPIFFSGDDFYIHPENVSEPIYYEGTVGLYELIFKKNPQGYKSNDLREYQDIARKTNLFYKDYDSSKDLQYNQSSKYNNIIKKIQKPLPPGNITYSTPRVLTRQQKQKQQEKEVGANTTASKIPTPKIRGGGSSLSVKNKKFKDDFLRTLEVTDKSLEFVPWSDPNTLVDRLRLLISSQKAGNNSHSNEIFHLVSALRRAKIII